MKLNDIYPLISSHQITLFAIEENKVHTIYPESIGAIPSTVKTLATFGDYEVVRLIPLDFQHIQITIKVKG